MKILTFLPERRATAMTAYIALQIPNRYFELNLLGNHIAKSTHRQQVPLICQINEDSAGFIFTRPKFDMGQLTLELCASHAIQRPDRFTPRLRGGGANFRTLRIWVRQGLGRRTFVRPIVKPERIYRRQRQIS